MSAVPSRRRNHAHAAARLRRITAALAAVVGGVLAWAAAVPAASASIIPVPADGPYGPAPAPAVRLMLTAPGSHKPEAPAGLGKLSARERELVTLVARGRTDAQIAGQPYISIRTVRSHLDRIRDKTGCCRRADLTRLALGAGLV